MEPRTQSLRTIFNKWLARRRLSQARHIAKISEHVDRHDGVHVGALSSQVGP
ncbi:MAG: hypothetical protein WBZ14_14305 [Terriglobales bacterium]